MLNDNQRLVAFVFNISLLLLLSTETSSSFVLRSTPFERVVPFSKSTSSTTNLDMAPPTTKEDDTEVRLQVPGKLGHVSSRGAANLALPMAYLAHHFTSIDTGNACHPTDNPQGYITVAVAENKLVTDLLQERLGTGTQTAHAGFMEDSEVYSYGPPSGLPVLKQAVATLLQDRFLGTASDTPEINPNHIAIGAGVMNFLSNLFFALGQSGDAVLIPAPYYAAFDNDVRAYAGCITVPVECQHPELGPTVQELQDAKDQAEAKGLKVRFLLLTNPHNPLGVVYTAEVLTSAISWARTQKMESIVDEIYALSVFGDDSKDNVKFESTLKLYKNDLGHDVHLLWGLSKDFGASGFRIGVLYTQNELLLEALGNLIAFAWVSHPMQRIMANMLSDTQFCDHFLTTSTQRLRASYQACTKVLTELDVPFVQAQAGMFVYLDLNHNDDNRGGIVATAQDEAILSDIFMTRARMVLTPGQTQHDPIPGRFRICYAYVSPEVLAIGMERLAKVMTKIRARTTGPSSEQEQPGLLGGNWIQEDKYWQDIL